ncbi:MAG: thrombospondin type 3 repeat-containing protein, partial [Cytophagia bacterium]|nr:thrombospondin type 3 repeat-containing protein [Cytophagia bacterium]
MNPFLPKAGLTRVRPFLVSLFTINFSRKLFFGVFLLTLFSIQALGQNLNYNARIVSFSAGNSSATWETGEEEYTWLGYLRDNSGTSNSGCVTRNIDGATTVNGFYAPLNRTNSTSNSLNLRIDAWEDDFGDRCQWEYGIFGNGDDGRVQMNTDFQFGSATEFTQTTDWSTGNSVFSATARVSYSYASISIDAAIDNIDEAITTGGNRPFWGAVGSWANNDGDVATSGTITDNQTSSMTMTVSGKSSIAFDWRVSSEANFDYLRVYINGVEQDRISGNVGWTNKTYQLTGGNDVIEWRYTKDGSVSSNLDRGFVDDVQLTDAPVGDPITTTAWRINNVATDIVTGVNQAYNGDPAAYAYMDIPETSDENWEAAPLDGNGAILFGGSNASNLGAYTCRTALDFTYFETFIDIPENFEITDLTVTFGAADDGARAYIFNSAHPEGAFRGQIALGDNSAVINDYSDLAVAGELNRLVIVQFDDCATGNNLRDAQITVNGEEIPVDNSAPPVVIAQDITVALGNDGTFVLEPSQVDNGSFSTLAGPVTLSLDQAYSFSCGDYGTTVTVTLTATDTNGEQSSTTANVTVNGGLDTDADGIPNSCDLDDDNDGILDINECDDNSQFFWSDAPTLVNPTASVDPWTSGLNASTSATGTINGIGYTYESNTPFSLTDNLFSEATFDADLNVPDQKSVQNIRQSENRLVFDEPMTNPILLFSSVGGANSVKIQFYNDFDVLFDTHVGTGSYITFDDVNNSLEGKEAYVVLRFNGTYSELAFDYLDDEF